MMCMLVILQILQNANFFTNQPAIISNHRASFVGGISVLNRDNGLQSLDLLLKSILSKWPDVEFVPIRDIFK